MLASAALQFLNGILSNLSIMLLFSAASFARDAAVRGMK